MTPQERYLRPFFGTLDSMDGEYAVIHSYEDLPYESEGDIDIAIHGIERREIEARMLRLCSELGWRITQRLWYDIPGCYYYVLVDDSNHDISLKIDLMFDEIGIGYTRYGSYFLTTDTLVHNDIRHSNQTSEFCYKLTKRIWKKYLTKDDVSKLYELFDETDIEIATEQLARQYGRTRADRLLSDFSERSFNETSLLDTDYDKVQRSRYRYGSVIRSLEISYWKLIRAANRIIEPCGAILTLPTAIFHAINEDNHLIEERVSDSFRKTTLEEQDAYTNFKHLSRSTLGITSHQRDHATLKLGYLKEPVRIRIENDAGDMKNINNTICELLSSRMLGRLPEASDR